jgi:hypothetical protein
MQPWEGYETHRQRWLREEDGGRGAQKRSSVVISGEGLIILPPRTRNGVLQLDLERLRT